MNFLKSRPENDVFLKLNQNFSYVISDTNTKERPKNEKEYEIEGGNTAITDFADQK